MCWDFINLGMNMTKTAMFYWTGLGQYVADFSDLAMAAAEPFQRMQKKAERENPPEQIRKDQEKILALNLEIASEGYAGATESMAIYHGRKIAELYNATLRTSLWWLDLPGEDIFQYWERMASSMQDVAIRYPQAIKDIEPEFGFHFDDGGYVLVAETPRFWLYRVLPIDSSVKIREDVRPVICRHPYVLGENILAFLPRDSKSIVHCFANQGVPTYAMVIKDIHANPAVQIMTGEDDILDTQTFCQHVKKIHNRMVTLFGICQGGTMSALAFLTGKLDGLADRLITAVAPIDGSKSVAFTEYMGKLPESGRTLGYSLVFDGETEVVSGKILAAVYRWRRFRDENPVSGFYRDVAMLEKSGGKIATTASALNYWLRYNQKDLPQAIAQIALDIYQSPIAPDGTLPIKIKLFGKDVNIRRMNEMPGFHWYLGYAPADNMVEVASALAPLEFLNKGIIKAVPYSKGHIGIASSHPVATSDCPLEGQFEISTTGEKCRGLVRFHIEGAI